MIQLAVNYTFCMRLVSSVLLLIYFTMIFQNAFLDGLHLVSHTSDLLTNQFKFHHHGNGKYHVHHAHDALELLQNVFSRETENESNNEQAQLQFQFKLHLYTPFIVNASFQNHIAQKLNSASKILYETILDILTPPPKG